MDRSAGTTRYAFHETRSAASERRALQLVVVAPAVAALAMALGPPAVHLWAALGTLTEAWILNVPLAASYARGVAGLVTAAVVAWSLLGPRLRSSLSIGPEGFTTQRGRRQRHTPWSHVRRATLTHRGVRVATTWGVHAVPVWGEEPQRRAVTDAIRSRSGLPLLADEAARAALRSQPDLRPPSKLAPPADPLEPHLDGSDLDGVSLRFVPSVSQTFGERLGALLFVGVMGGCAASSIPYGMVFGWVWLLEAANLAVVNHGLVEQHFLRWLMVAWVVGVAGFLFRPRPVVEVRIGTRALRCRGAGQDWTVQLDQIEGVSVVDNASPPRVMVRDDQRRTWDIPMRHGKAERRQLAASIREAAERARGRRDGGRPDDVPQALRSLQQQVER